MEQGLAGGRPCTVESDQADVSKDHMEHLGQFRSTKKGEGMNELGSFATTFNTGPR